MSTTSRTTTRVGAALAVLLAVLLGAPGPGAQAAAGTRPAGVFSGYGVWVDLWDYDPDRTGGRPPVTPASVDAMARAGAQVLYLQSARPGGPDLAQPALLRAFVARASARGMKVVLWYLPTTTSPAADLRRLLAAARVPGVDGVAVDAESVVVRDVADRNARLVRTVRAFRAATTVPIGLVVPSPTGLARFAPPTWWPGYPFAELAPYGDAWLPMTYWAYHRGEVSVADQVASDVRALRAAGWGLPVHVIGSGEATPAEADAFVATLRAAGAAGGSVYDWASTRTATTEHLAPLRTLSPSPSGPHWLAGRSAFVAPR